MLSLKRPKCKPLLSKYVHKFVILIEKSIDFTTFENLFKIC